MFTSFALKTLTLDLYLFVCFLINLFILRERENMSRGGAGREGERIPSRLHTAGAEPAPGLRLTKPGGHALSLKQGSDT